TELYKELHLENGFIPVDANMETEMKGVYAVGDIRVKPVRQVSTAVADGTIAAIHAAS
ncbi:MAG: FAD-dependent oxidoreductase, partial [Lachnospiraceae bacterium]